MFAKVTNNLNRSNQSPTQQDRRKNPREIKKILSTENFTKDQSDDLKKKSTPSSINEFINIERFTRYLNDLNEHPFYKKRNLSFLAKKIIHHPQSDLSTRVDISFTELEILNGLKDLKEIDLVIELMGPGLEQRQHFGDFTYQQIIKLWASLNSSPPKGSLLNFSV
jgi:hypothetical protein